MTHFSTMSRSRAILRRRWKLQQLRWCLVATVVVWLCLHCVASAFELVKSPAMMQRRGPSPLGSAVSPKVDIQTTSNNDDGESNETQQRAVAPIEQPLSWSDYFQSLQEFQDEHGHCRVPKRSPGKLGSWVSRQRQRKDRLTETQITLLDSIGFCWNTKNDGQQQDQNRVHQQWWERVREIQSTRRQVLSSVGSSSATAPNSVPPSLEESLTDSQLDWLRRQRNAYLDHFQWGISETCKLDAEQLEALSTLHPQWYKTPGERKWQIQFEALQEFEREHGHCNVPRAHSNKKLAYWVQTTRKRYRAVKVKHLDKERLKKRHVKPLTEEQMAQLDDIGFDFDPWGHYSCPGQGCGL